MSVTCSAIRLSAQDVLGQWSSTLTNPTFYVYRNGIFDGTTKATSRVYRVPPGETLWIDVFDSPTGVPTSGVAGRLYIGFDGVVDATTTVSHYLLREKISGAWTPRDKKDDNGEGWFQFITRWLPDVTVAEFQVVSVDMAGNEGLVREFSVLIVRGPDAPVGTWTYDAEAGTVSWAQ